MRSHFSRNVSGAWSAQGRVVLDKTREEGKGQITKGTEVTEGLWILFKV